VGNGSVHLLDVIISVILELLLALGLDLKLVDSGLQVSRGRESAGNGSNMVGLFRS